MTDSAESLSRRAKLHGDIGVLSHVFTEAFTKTTSYYLLSFAGDRSFRALMKRRRGAISVVGSIAGLCLAVNVLHPYPPTRDLVAALVENENVLEVAAVSSPVVLSPTLPAEAPTNPTLLKIAEFSKVDDQAALKVYTQAMRTYPTSELSRLISGKLKLLQGDHAQAIAAFSDAIKRDPKNALALISRADAYLKTGNFRSALSDYNEALRLQPDDPTATNNLAVIYRALGEQDAAEATFKRAIALQQRVGGDISPATATLVRNLAVLHEEMGRYAEAESDLRQALQIREGSLGPRDASKIALMTQLGQIYQKQGRIAEAERLYRSAITQGTPLAETQPKNASWQADLAAAHERLGDLFLSKDDPDEALKSYRMAASIREKITAGDTSDPASDLALLSTYRRLVLSGDDLDDRRAQISASFERLKDAKEIAPEQSEWLSLLEAEFAKAPKR